MRLPLLTRVLSRPALAAQIVNALTALGVFVVLTRQLPPRDFTTYAALMASYAIATSAVGTSVSTTVIDALAGRDQTRVPLAVTRDVGAWLLGALAVAIVAISLNADTSTVFAACGGFGAWIASELAGGIALGRRRFGDYLKLAIGRSVAWSAATVALVPLVAPDSRLAVALAAGAMSGAVPVAYLARTRIVSLRVHVPSRRLSTSLLGLTQVSLWIIASSDRIILAKLDVPRAAVYAATYSLLDRGFRTLASGEILQYLPNRLAERGGRGHGGGKYSSTGVIVIVAVAVGAAVVSPSLVQLLSDGRYRPTLALSALLAASLALMLLGARAYAEAVAVNRLRLLSIASTMVAAANVTGNVVLVPLYGVMGAAITTLASYLIWLLTVGYAAGVPRLPAVATRSRVNGRWAARIRHRTEVHGAVHDSAST